MHLEHNGAKAKDFEHKVPQLLVIVIKINGHDACALLNSRSLANFMSTRFADSINAHCIQLAKPLPIQLAVEGSRSMIHWCTDAHVLFDKINETQHFDIMNLQDYDIILGTSFLFQHKISIALNPLQVYVRSANALPIHREQISKISSRVIDAQTNAIQLA